MCIPTTVQCLIAVIGHFFKVNMVSSWEGHVLQHQNEYANVSSEFNCCVDR